MLHGFLTLPFFALVIPAVALSTPTLGLVSVLLTAHAMIALYHLISIQFYAVGFYIKWFRDILHDFLYKLMGFMFFLNVFIFDRFFGYWPPQLLENRNSLVA